MYLRLNGGVFWTTANLYLTCPGLAEQKGQVKDKIHVHEIEGVITELDAECSER